MKSADSVFLCLHGYGQLAPYFIKKFEVISDTSLIIVPEGLHRFYLAGNDGRVGASWMTKEDRLIDIENYLHYIDAVVNEILGSSTRPIIVLGFSQGAATAGRWVSHTQRSVSNIILWSGMFPHDVETPNEKKTWKDIKIHSVLGNKDPYIGDDRFIAEKQRLTLNGLNADEFRFDGGHDILPNVLLQIKDRILR